MLSIFPLEIRTLILLAFSYGLAFFLINPLFNNKILIKWLVIALLVNIVISLGSISLLAFFIFCVYLFISKQSPSTVLSYYVVMLVMAPVSIGFSINDVFGLNHLAQITYPKLLSLFILLPLFAKHIKRSRKNGRVAGVNNKWKKIDRLFFIWLGYLFIMTLRAESFTSSLRESLYIFLDVALPYYVFSRYIIGREEFLKVSGAMLVSILILTAVTFVEIVVSWSFVRNHIPNELMLSDTFYHVARRGGTARLGSTLGEPLGYGYVLLIWLATFIFMRKSTFNTKNGLLLAAIMLWMLSIWATGSRASLSLIIPILALAFYFKNTNRSRAKIISIAYISVSIIFIILLPGLVSYDIHGTFQYRIDLLEQSWVIIKNNIFTGSTDFKEYLESLRQGQGIIDIVNTYVGVTLKYGFVGLIIFVSLFSVPLNMMNKIQFGLNNIDRNIALWLISSLAATMLYIFTTSSISVISYYYWMLIGLATAFVRYSLVDDK